MVTINEYKAGFQADRNGFRETVKGWRDAVHTLDEMQRDDYLSEKLPSDTVAEFVRIMGKKDARFIIASLVNRTAWDGRISADVAAWAAGVTDALDEETANAAQLFSNMHPAHLDQIARAMMEYKAEPAPAPMPEFKGISAHSDAKDVISEYVPALLDALNSDELEALENLNEWDGMSFYVFDIAPRSEYHAHGYIVAVTDGFNASNTLPLDEFAAGAIREAIEWAKEWAE